MTFYIFCLDVLYVYRNILIKMNSDFVLLFSVWDFIEDIRLSFHFFSVDAYASNSVFEELLSMSPSK